VQRPGLTSASAASTSAQSTQSNATTSAPEPKRNAPELSLPTPPNPIPRESSVRSVSIEKQTRQENVSQDHRVPSIERPVVLATDSVARGISTALRHGYTNVQPATAAAIQPAAIATQDGDHESSTRTISQSLAGKKRKAAELGSSRPEHRSNQAPDITLREAGRPTIEPSVPASHPTADVPLPSIETESVTPAVPKSKRAAPKPRAQPRVKKAAPPATESGGLQPSAANIQQANPSQNGRPSSSRAPSTAQSEADALLQNVTSQFSAVSQLADGIDGTSRAAILARSGANQPASGRGTVGLANALNRAAHRQTQARTAADLAAEIIAEATGADSDVRQDTSSKPKRKRRKRTPEDAEEHVIDPAETKMGDLTRDTGRGKKSGIEIALEKVDWKAVKQQKKEMADEQAKQQELERQEKGSGKPKKRKKAPGEKADEALVPQMTVVNGVIVSVAESREIDIRQDAEADAARDDANVITIDKLTMRKNQNTIGKPKGLQGKQLQWTEEMDERFYKGVRMFGADMLMVSSLFPNLERGHVKRKFVREERANPERLREALFNPIALDDQTYQAETGVELNDPRKLDEELKAMEVDLRKRFETTLAEQSGGARHEPIEIDDADIPLPSRELGSEDPEAGSPTQSRRPGRENRFDNVADDIINDVLGVRSAGQKKGKKKAAPASAAPGRKKKDGSVATAPRKGTKAAKQAAALQQLGGTVEAIGMVDD
jgi:transcription factor TFIIIB component B''